MKKLGFSLIVFFVLSQAFAFTGEIGASYPTPGSCPTGLTFDGKYLWNADSKSDLLYCIDPQDGEIIRSIPSPGFWPMGLCWDGQYLWNVDVNTGRIYQIDPTDGTIIRTLAAPTGSPRGLCWDGQYLWCSDNRSEKIVQFSPEDGTTIREFTAPAKESRGLCFDGRYLWIADRGNDEIYMVDPASGSVLLITEAPGPFTRGLAYDGRHLWAVDYQNDQLYRLKIRDSERFVRRDQRDAKITLTHQVRNYGYGQIKTLDVHLAIPSDRDNQRIHDKILYTPQPTDILSDQWGQETAHFRFTDIHPSDVVTVQSVTTASIYEVRYFIYPDQVGPLTEIPKKIRNSYLIDNEKYQINHPVIQKAVRTCLQGEENPYWIARRIFDYLIENMYYEMVGGWNTAPTVLERGNGSCSEYSFVYIAMCRAAGLPARYVGSVVVRGDDASLDDVYHRWVEVYLPNYGWVPVDPSGGDNDLPRDQANYFGHLSNSFLITTQGGGASKTLGWTYNSNEFWTTDPQTNVQIEAFAEWEPLENTAE